MTSKPPSSAIAQDQFLDVMSRDAAIAEFLDALKPAPLDTETVPLDRLLRRVLASDVTAPVDAPPFDRSVVDGFAVRAADLAKASTSTPARLVLSGEIVPCGVNPRLPVNAGAATPVATGAPIPRGADAVIMIEHTEPDGEGAILVKRVVGPGQNISFAGSDIARGQTLIYQGTVVTAREIAMLAAVGCAETIVWRRPRVGVLSTGDELVQPGFPLGAGEDLRLQCARGCRRSRGKRLRACEARRARRRRGEPRARHSSRLRHLRRRDPVRRHIEGRGRSHLPDRRPARPAGHSRPWRRAQAR
jgi:putative molybdopterin biosynthesis protein